MNIFYFWDILITVISSSWFYPVLIGYLGLFCFSVLVNMLNGD